MGDSTYPTYNPISPTEYDNDIWESTGSNPFENSFEENSEDITECLTKEIGIGPDGDEIERCNTMRSDSGLRASNSMGIQTEPPLSWQDEKLDRFLAWFKRYRSLTLMVGFYLGGFSLILLHFFFNLYLDHRRPEDTYPQRYVTITGVILANLAKASLLAGLGVAYIQVVWYRLRRKWTSARLVDRLLSLPWSPGDLFYLQTTFWRAPFEWFFALFCILVPIVLSIPTGSMKVGMEELRRETSLQEVVGVNLTYRPNESWDGTNEGALFNGIDFLLIKSGGDYTSLTVADNITTKIPIKRLAASVVLRGEIEVWPNPMAETSHNASYEFSFTGPRYDCVEEEPYDHILDFVQKIVYKNWASDLRANLTDSTRHQFRMWGNELQFGIFFVRRFRKPKNVTTGVDENTFESFEGLSEPMERYTCYLGLTNYTASVNYTDNKGVVGYTTDGSFEKIKPSSGLFPYYIQPYSKEIFETQAWLKDYEGDPYPDVHAWFYYSNVKKYDKTVGVENVAYDALPLGDETAPIVSDDSRDGNQTPFSKRFLQMQARGISKALFEILEGYFSNFGLQIEQFSNTIVAQAPTLMTTYPDEPGFFDINITPSLLNELIANISLSLPNIAPGTGWNTQAEVTTISWAYVYDFNRRYLVFPYASILIVSLFLVLTGIYALQSNGVSSSKGFLQIVTTTTGSEALRAAAAECCLGGEENFARKLCKLELKFGDRVEVAGGEEEEEERLYVRGGGKRVTSYSSGVERREGWITTLGTRSEVEKIRVTDERRTVGDVYGLLRWKKRKPGAGLS